MAVEALLAPEDIVPGDIWTLTPAEGLGVGAWAIPAGAEVEILDVLDPFSPGVAQSSDFTVRAIYEFVDFGFDDSGMLVESANSRTLAYAEPIFRSLFAPAGGAE
ncbi:hypothetical protein ACFYP4_02595 [Streptomyces sp. NPDC005551]|uniref:hypothetical protein n=1 Tax=Streptomyces sp. NPDC005551 TaxID=3364725 RepID=UPI0036995E20